MKLDNETNSWEIHCPHVSRGWCQECVARLGLAVRDYLDSQDDRTEHRVRAALICCEPSDAEEE